MRSKLFLPIMAMVFAIGLSFATENPSVNPQADFILLNGVWEEIPEQPCMEGPRRCQVQFGDEQGPVFDVYDAEDVSTLKHTSSKTPTIIEGLSG